jgi:hypothetical protein
LGHLKRNESLLGSLLGLRNMTLQSIITVVDFFSQSHLHVLEILEHATHTRIHGFLLLGAARIVVGAEELGFMYRCL